MAHKLCADASCKKQPTYGWEGGKATFCKQHKDDGMIDVVNPQCADTQCHTRPCFGFLGGKATFCKRHKAPGMIDITSKACADPTCSTQAQFGFEGERAIYCGRHQLPGMSNVKSTKCVSKGCRIRPIFGFEGGPATHCDEHQLPDMIDVRHTMCASPGCSTRPSFGLKGGEAEFCLQHKRPDMIDVVNRRCFFDDCDTIVTGNAKKYRGYCVFHYVNLFPNEPVARQFKVKEQLVVEFLINMLGDPEIDFIHDKTVPGGCSRRRPDILIRTKTHVIIVEIDENQHRTYTCSCEEKRAMQLWLDVEAEREPGDFRPIVFIRFNPDDYLDANGKKVPSCFGVHKQTGTYGIRAKHSAAWAARLDVLLQVVRRHMANVPVQDFTEEYLFYNGFV